MMAEAGVGDDRQEVKIVFKNVPYTIGGAKGGTRGGTSRGASSRGTTSTSTGSYYPTGRGSDDIHENDQRFLPYEGENLSKRAAISLGRLGAKLGGKGEDAVPETPPTSNAPTEVTRNSGLAFLATAILGALDKQLLTGDKTKGNDITSDYTLALFASGAMGVSITNVFNDPEGPYNQPVNVFFGHLLSVIAGVISTQLPNSVGALVRNSFAIGLATLLMRTFKVYHPPATATASCIVAIRAAGGSNDYVKVYFLRTIISTIIILGVALLSNLNKGFQYPRTWAWGGVDFRPVSQLSKRLQAKAEARLQQLKERKEEFEKRFKQKAEGEVQEVRLWLKQKIEEYAFHAYHSIADGSFSVEYFKDDILDNIDNIREYLTFENIEKIARGEGGIGMIDQIKKMVF